MTDIVERLREPNRGKTEHEAADEIERLRTENKRLQGLLCAEGANRHYWLQVTEIERLLAENELLRGTDANRYWEGRWRDAEAVASRIK